VALIRFREWFDLKVSYFEQTIAVPRAVIVITGGLHCPGLTQRQPSIIRLGGVAALRGASVGRVPACLTASNLKNSVA